MNISERIQRLIDDELDNAGRTQLLRHLDKESPESWRDLALGLLEARMLADALRAGPRAVDPSTPVAAPRPQRWLLGLAAALVLCVGFGLLLSPSPQNPPLAMGTPAEEGVAPPSYGTILLRSGDEGALEIPVVDLSRNPADLGRTVQAATEPMRRMGANYSERGWKPQLRTSYISADLDDGKQLLLPVSYLSVSRTREPEPGPENQSPPDNRTQQNDK